MEISNAGGVAAPTFTGEESVEEKIDDAVTKLCEDIGEERFDLVLEGLDALKKEQPDIVVKKVTQHIGQLKGLIQKMVDAKSAYLENVIDGFSQLGVNISPEDSNGDETLSAMTKRSASQEEASPEIESRPLDSEIK